MYAGVPSTSPCFGESLGPGGAHCSRDAEVRHQRVATLEQDVLRLDIAMDHPVPVGVAQRVRHLARDAQRVVEGELLLALQPVAQRFPFYEGHDVVEESAGRFRRTPGVVQRQDVRMVQVGGRRDLAQKALGPEGVDQLGTEDLYRYLALVLEVVREIDRSHPARAKLAVEAVAIGQGALKSGLEIGQVGRQGESAQT